MTTSIKEEPVTNYPQIPIKHEEEKEEEEGKTEIMKSPSPQSKLSHLLRSATRMDQVHWTRQWLIPLVMDYVVRDVAYVLVSPIPPLLLSYLFPPLPLHS